MLEMRCGDDDGAPAGGREWTVEPLRASTTGRPALGDHVRNWGAGHREPAGLAEAADGSDAPDAAFWAGVARVETGELTVAATALRGWLDERGPWSPVLATHATALLRYAETGLVEAARWLGNECGDDWARRCPFAVDRVVATVADADPLLLAVLLRGYPETVTLDEPTRVHAAHRMLQLACDAPHSGLAASRLDLAERLLVGG